MDLFGQLLGRRRGRWGRRCSTSSVVVSTSGAVTSTWRLVPAATALVSTVFSSVAVEAVAHVALRQPVGRGVAVGVDVGGGVVGMDVVVGIDEVGFGVGAVGKDVGEEDGAQHLVVV